MPKLTISQILIILGLLCTAFVLIVWINTMLHRYPIDNAGAYGDAINGLLGPFINLLAALLVFISFRAQIQANELLSWDVAQQNLVKRIELFGQDSYPICESLSGITVSMRVGDRWNNFDVGFRVRNSMKRLLSIQTSILELSESDIALLYDFYLKHCTDVSRHVGYLTSAMDGSSGALNKYNDDELSLFYSLKSIAREVLIKHSNIEHFAGHY